MTAVVCPAYLPNIHYCSWIIAQKQPYFVRDTHFQKQTFRNRTEIYGANGKLKLTLPIVHNKSKSHQKEEEVQITKTTAWQKQHWKSICSAYRSSPYFEFYEADLISLYKEEVTHLMQFNLDLLNKIMELIEFSMSYKIVEWKKDTHRRMDDLVNAKKSVQINFEPYRQVFEEKNGFIPNLSIIDLLFNLGPDTLNYLQKHSLKI
ncbi:MAG: hypothetical protein CBC08_02485 [Flavobacteriaceae bacterium TMED48]|nr:MAG: hypothetical protein CBC08_02485 [Flavobacteriaceae bacterium TMED48]